MSNSVLEQDQDDITGRLVADSVFANTVTVFSQRKGITENDVMTALGATNQTGGKAGLVAIVLMPKLKGDAPDAPGPRYITRYAVQIIDWPLMRRVAGGAGMSAEQLCERTRQILHMFSNSSQQTIVFDGMEPAPMTDQTQISYIVYFRRLGADAVPARVATVAISPNGGVSPQTVTLACNTATASIYFTTDGSYPSSANATATLYSAPFAVSSPQTLRCSAQLSGYQQSNISQAVFT